MVKKPGCYSRKTQASESRSNLVARLRDGLGLRARNEDIAIKKLQRDPKPDENPLRLVAMVSEVCGDFGHEVAEESRESGHAAADDAEWRFRRS